MTTKSNAIIPLQSPAGLGRGPQNSMKIAPLLEAGRILTGHWGSASGNDFGAFSIMGPCCERLKIIASPGDAHEEIPWEHVSVSCRNRCPRWEEMCWVKDLFWEPEEAKARAIARHKPIFDRHGNRGEI